MTCIVLLFLAICLFAPVIAQAASEKGEYVRLHDAVASYLDGEGYAYSYDVEKHRFSYGMKLDSTLSQCDVAISIKTDGFNVYAYSPITPKRDDPAQLAAVAEFITRANYNMTTGCFEMDYTDGELRFRTSIMCYDATPTHQIIARLVDIPPLMIDRYGDGLAKVILTGADPAKAVEDSEK